MSDIQVHKITSASEFITISHLIHAYFDETGEHLNYTKQDFFVRLMPLLYNDNNLFLYVTDDSKPVAYLCAFRVNLFVRDAIMPFQVYSTNVKYMKEMAKVLDEWTKNKGFNEQVFLVLPKHRLYFTQTFGAKTDLIYMTRRLNDAQSISESTGSISDTSVGPNRESTGNK